MWRPSIPYCAGRKRQLGFRMCIGEMQSNGSRLIQHQAAVLEHRDEPIGIELQILLALMRSAISVDEDQPMLNSDLLEQDMRREADVAGIVVKLDRRYSPIE